MGPDTEVVVEESFEVAAKATRKRNQRLTPGERLEIHAKLLQQFFSDGLDARIQGTFEVIER